QHVVWLGLFKPANSAEPFCDRGRYWTVHVGDSTSVARSQWHPRTRHSWLGRRGLPDAWAASAKVIQFRASEGGASFADGAGEAKEAPRETNRRSRARQTSNRKDEV